MAYQERRTEKRKSPVGPKRIIFYRDGVSEGQYKKVLEEEIPQIRGECFTVSQYNYI